MVTEWVNNIHNKWIHILNNCQQHHISNQLLFSRPVTATKISSLMSLSPKFWWDLNLIFYFREGESEQSTDGLEWNSRCGQWHLDSPTPTSPRKTTAYFPKLSENTMFVSPNRNRLNQKTKHRSNMLIRLYQDHSDRSEWECLEQETEVTKNVTKSWLASNPSCD